MPRYEYTCKKCGYTWETFSQMIDHEKVKSCPECKEPTERTTFGPMGMKIFGQGWYGEDKGYNNEKRRFKDKKKKK